MQRGSTRLQLIVLAAGVLLASMAAANDPSGGSLEATWKPVGGTRQFVTIGFHREEAGAGRISVKLPGLGPFAGEYLRMNQDKTGSRSERLYTRWRAEAYDRFEQGPSGQSWDRGSSALDTFRTRHRGRVLATMIGGGGLSIRCSFTLITPELGLPGGAWGACQVTDGSVVEIPEPSAQ